MNNLISEELFNFYKDKPTTKIFDSDEVNSVLEFSSKTDRIFYGNIGNDYDAAYLAINKNNVNEENKSKKTVYKFSPKNEFTNADLRKDLDSRMKTEIPFLSCIVDEKECHGFSDILVKDFLSSYENTFSLLNNSFVENDNENKIKEIIAECEDLYTYQEELFNISDGYESIFQEDLSKLSLKFPVVFHKIVLSLKDELVKNYFSYDDSEIEDLSVVNGVRCYVWKKDHYSNGFSYNLGLLILRSIVDFYNIDEKYLNENLRQEFEQQEMSKSLEQFTQHKKNEEQELFKKDWALVD